MVEPTMPELPKGELVRFRCGSCEGSGTDGHLRYMGDWQPPEEGRCTDCDGRGWCEESGAHGNEALTAYGKECATAATAQLRERVQALEKALREAEAGLEFAGADKEPTTDFVPAPTLALRSVRAALSHKE